MQTLTALHGLSDARRYFDELKGAVARRDRDDHIAAREMLAYSLGEMERSMRLSFRDERYDVLQALRTETRVADHVLAVRDPERCQQALGVIEGHLDELAGGRVYEMVGVAAVA